METIAKFLGVGRAFFTVIKEDKQIRDTINEKGLAEFLKQKNTASNKQNRNSH